MTIVGLDPLFWRLVYANGSVVTEPVANASVLTARPGAVELHVVPFGSHPIVRIAIPAGDRPVWYRLRSAGFGTGIRLDATVFGYAHENAQGLPDGTLWAAMGGRIIDCPPDLVQFNTIAAQIGLDAAAIGRQRL